MTKAMTIPLKAAIPWEEPHLTFKRLVQDGKISVGSLKQTTNDERRYLQIDTLQ